MAMASVGLLLLIILMCYVVLFILYNIRDFNKTDVHTADLVGGSQSEMHKRNCDVETVYSVTDSQCQVVCKPPGVFSSRNGACINVLAFSTDNALNKCDPKKGVLAFLLGDPQFGSTKTRCYSVDPGIQPDNPDGKNIICNHGSINIDYVKSFPQLTDCQCTDPSRSVLTYVANTKEVRKYGVCVNEKMLPLYRHNDLLYDSSVI